MVKREDGDKLAKEYSVTFMETSAKSGLNVEIAFMAVARYCFIRLVHKLHSDYFSMFELLIILHF